LILFSTLSRRILRSTLFPYTTLFRSKSFQLEKDLQLYLWNIGYDGSCVYISSVIWKLCWRLCLCGQSTIIYSHHTIQSCSLLERSEEHTSELQSRFDIVCLLLLEKQN